jgi:tetratricopeptide (TPR) repeat protein
LVIVFFYYRDAVALGFIQDGGSRVGDVLGLALRLTLLYVVLGYGVALFFYHTLIKPYLWKLFVLRDVLLSARDLLVVQAFALLTLILATGEVRLALYFTDDDRGRRWFEFSLTRLSPEEVFWACFSLLVLGLLVLLYLRRPIANWRAFLIGLLFIFGMSATGLSPTYGRAYADAQRFASERSLLYKNEYIPVLVDNDIEGTYWEGYDQYYPKNESLKKQQLEALLLSIKLARNSEERALSYYSLAIFSVQNYTMIKSETFNIILTSYLLDNNNGWINEQMAEGYIARRDYDQAIKYSLRCIERIDQIMDPSECYDSLILGHWYKGETVEALAAAREVYKLYPRWPRALWWRNLMEVLAQIYRHTPESVHHLLDEMGQVCARSGRGSEECMILDVQRVWGLLNYQAAERYFDKLFESYPNSARGRELYDRMKVEQKMLEGVYTPSLVHGMNVRMEAGYQLLYEPVHGMSI